MALLAPLAFLALLVAANWTVVALAEARLRAAAAEARAAQPRGEITGEEAARQVSILLDDRDRRLYAVAVIEGAPPRIEVTGPRSSAGLIGPFGVLAFGDLFVQVDGRPDRSPTGAAAPEADPLGRVTRAEREAAAAAAEAPSPAGPVIPGAEDGR
ncbi:MAG: hypothetical protein VX463_11315 [Pseudomonadota bacterium]|nr:hypothetical protein [Pseudomonadota bacterium]